MALPTTLQVTNKYLYGQETTPANKVSDALIRADNATTSMNISLSEFMTSGAGRFAVGAQFELVQQFFANGASGLAANTVSKPYYTKEEVAVELGISEYGFELDNKNYSDGVDDLGERVYIFNNTHFQITNSAKFIVQSNGTVRIDDFGVEVRTNFDGQIIKENFDFDGGDVITQIANGSLEDAIDPSGIGRKVEFNFTDSVSTQTYTLSTLQAQQSLMATWTNPSYSLINQKVVGIATSLWNNGTTKFLDGSKPVLYGTSGNDLLSEGNINGSVWADANGVPTIDDSAYEDQGVVLIAGAGNDQLLGTSYEDKLIGGTGDDLYYATAGGDRLIDSDGQGRIISIGGNTLEGKAEYSPDEDHPQTDRWILRINGTDHFLSRQPGTGELQAGGFIVENFRNGDLGIFLEGKPGGTDDDPEPDPEITDAGVDFDHGRHVTPLIVDLNGDGFDFNNVAAAGSTAFFDLTGNHFATRTSWDTGSDGFLVRDLNGDGKIHDITEMFGANGSTTAWQKLAALDGNASGTLTGYT